MDFHAETVNPAGVFVATLAPLYNPIAPSMAASR